MLEHLTRFTRSYDLRDTPPGGRSFGINSMDLIFIVRGPLGAVNWTLSTGWYVESARSPSHRFDRTDQKPWPIDLGYHSHKPADYQSATEPSQPSCTFLDGAPCWYDGTSLGAEDLLEGFLAGGDAWLWPKLEAIYHSRFEAGPWPTFEPEYLPHPDREPKEN